MTTPRVTVLMSVHNGAPYLRAAVDSVLAQTFGDFEFLIIDDASTDDSAAIVESVRDPRVRLLRQRENIGLTRCLNLGLREARGEWVARQDADDLSAPGRLQKQTTFLAAHPDVSVLGTEARLMDAAGQTTGRRWLPHETAGLRWMALFVNPFIHTSIMFRREAVLKLGGYDESFAVCQDYALWLRVIRDGPVANLAEPLVSVREHGESVSQTRREAATEAVRRTVTDYARWLLPDRMLSSDELRLLCAFRRTLPAADIVGFARLLSELTQLYPERFADARSSADFRHTRALLDADFAYRALTTDRGTAVRRFVRAVRAEPAMAARVPWSRVLALLLLGERAREIYTRVVLGSARSQRLQNKSPRL